MQDIFPNIQGHNISIYFGHRTEENINVFCCHSLIHKSAEKKTDDDDEITWGSDELPIEVTNHEDSNKGKKFISNFLNQKLQVEKKSV